MPYGISPAPKYFQQKLDQNLQGLPGIYRIADDLLITGQGDTKEGADKDHDANLVQLFQRCRERNIKLNKAKFNFKCQQVTFIGHLLSSEGVEPDPRKIDAIVNMETPVDVQGVQRLIGMKKAKEAGRDPYLSLLDWRNTPSEGMSSSPAQRMFGRRTRTLLPTTSYLLKPKVQEDVKEKLLMQKSKQAKYYNQNTKELLPLETGEVVRVAPKPGDRERK